MSDELLMIKMELEEARKSQEKEYEEFYENIEAPKFVDFTTPDHYCPDDRYWFCQRQGCDQKHEEEMDSETIYKNFVLRVMAARSPNVKLQKALNRNALSKTMKYPMSAPPKSSKRRVSKLALISSLSRKLVDDKGDVTKLKPNRTFSSTPKAKTKQVAAKYLTTPRNRKGLQNETSFRSVQHPKPGATASKDRTVVKALVFHAPKRSITIKTSVELKKPLSKLRNQKKPAGLLRKRVAFKEESGEKIRSGAQIEKTKVVSSRSGQISTKRVADKGPKLGHTDQKPKEFNGGEIASCTEPPSTVKSDLITLGVSRDLENASNSKQIPVKENNLPNLQVPNLEDAPRGAEIESEVTYSENKENELPKSEETNIENAPLGVGIGSEVTDSDDKENSSAIDANSLNKTNSEARSKIMRNGRGKAIKDVQLVEKSTKEGIIPIKVKKPKPTNPKPFRFRTDERGILKEAANMEKKHLLGSKREPAKPFVEGKSKRKLAKDIQGDGKLLDKCKSDIVKCCPKMPERRILAEVTSGETIQVEQEGKVSVAATSNRVMPTRKMGSSLKREMAQPEREAKSSSLAPAQTLNKVVASSVSRPRKTMMNRKENRACEPSQKRLTVTVPKEPNFRTANRPKSCTKQVV